MNDPVSSTCHQENWSVARKGLIALWSLCCTLRFTHPTNRSKNSTSDFQEEWTFQHSKTVRNIQNAVAIPSETAWFLKIKKSILIDWILSCKNSPAKTCRQGNIQPVWLQDDPCMIVRSPSPLSTRLWWDLWPQWFPCWSRFRTSHRNVLLHCPCLPLHELEKLRAICVELPYLLKWLRTLEMLGVS